MRYRIVYKQKKASEYDQEIPQLHTADQPMASRGRATEHCHKALGRKLKQTNQLSSPSR